MNKIYYLDDNNNIVDMKESTHFIIHEYDDNGTLIGEEFGIGPVGKKQKRMERIVYTVEEIEFLNSIKDDKGNHPFKR